MTQTKERRHEANGAAITRARRNKGISQERLSVMVNTTRRHMIRLENGEHLPSGDLRDRIAEACGVERAEIKSADDDAEEESDPIAGATVEDLLRALLERVSRTA